MKTFLGRLKLHFWSPKSLIWPPKIVFFAKSWPPKSILENKLAPRRFLNPPRRSQSATEMHFRGSKACPGHPRRPPELPKSCLGDVWGVLGRPWSQKRYSGKGSPDPSPATPHASKRHCLIPTGCGGNRSAVSIRGGPTPGVLNEVPHEFSLRKFS